MHDDWSYVRSSFPDHAWLICLLTFFTLYPTRESLDKLVIHKPTPTPPVLTIHTCFLLGLSLSPWHFSTLSKLTNYFEPAFDWKLILHIKDLNFLKILHHFLPPDPLGSAGHRCWQTNIIRNSTMLWRNEKSRAKKSLLKVTILLQGTTSSKKIKLMLSKRVRLKLLWLFKRTKCSAVCAEQPKNNAQTFMLCNA